MNMFIHPTWWGLWFHRKWTSADEAGLFKFRTAAFGPIHFIFYRTRR